MEQKNVSKQKSSRAEIVSDRTEIDLNRTENVPIGHWRKVVKEQLNLKRFKND